VKRRDGITLRAADVNDVDDIADLFLACWRISYRDVLPPRLVAMYGPAGARDLWQRSFAQDPGTREVVVAEQSDHSVVGVVAIGSDPDDVAAGHIFSLYVHPQAQELGIGARLVSAAIGRFRADGLSRASLWVFEANAGGRAFYDHLGWRADGTVRVEPEYGEPELRFTRSLSAADGLP